MCLCRDMIVQRLVQQAGERVCAFRVANWPKTSQSHESQAPVRVLLAKGGSPVAILYCRRLGFLPFLCNWPRAACRRDNKRASFDTMGMAVLRCTAPPRLIAVGVHTRDGLFANLDAHVLLAGDAHAHGWTGCCRKDHHLVQAEAG